MDDNISEKPKRRGSFLDFLPSNDLPTVNEIPVHRTSFLEGNEPTKKNEKPEQVQKAEPAKVKRGSFVDGFVVKPKVEENATPNLTPKEPEEPEQVQKIEPVKVKRGSFVDGIVVQPKVEEKPKRTSTIENAAPHLKPKTRTFVEGPRDSVFKGKERPDVENAMRKIQSEFPEFYKEHQRRLENMVEKLIPPTILLVSTWGDNAVIDQRELVENTTLLVREFSSTNGDQLLNDVIKSAGYQSEKSLFAKLKNSFSDSFTDKKIDYVAEVESLKIHLSGLIPKMDEQFEKSKDTILPLWMIAISGVSQTYETDDLALAEYLDSRRQLLQHAYINVNTSRSQLEQVRILAVKMYSQIDHVMNVTIPAMMRNQ